MCVCVRYVCVCVFCMWMACDVWECTYGVLSIAVCMCMCLLVSWHVCWIHVHLEWMDMERLLGEKGGKTVSVAPVMIW